MVPTGVCVCVHVNGWEEVRSIHEMIIVVTCGERTGYVTGDCKSGFSIIST